MRILLTGAGGQLGHDLVEALHDLEVRALGHRELDVADRRAVSQMVQATHPDWIINAAAFNDVDGAESAREAAFAVNAEAPAYLAEAAKAAGARLLHISTDYVFSGRKGEPYTETDTPEPLSVYGASKRAGEVRVLDSGARACVLRTAWLYGSHGNNFVNAILRAASAGRPLRVVSDQVGSPTSTRDLAAAIRDLLGTDLVGLFHVVNSGACSRFEFAKAIVDGVREVEPVKSSEMPRPAPRPANSSMRSVRWGQSGMTPMRSWQEALADFLRNAGGG